MSSSLGWLPRFSLQRRCCRRHNTPGNQTHPADRAAPTNTLSLSETRVVSSCGSGGSDHHSPSLPRPQAASPDTPVTTGDDQLSIQLREVMPCLSSYPLVLLSSAFGHLIEDNTALSWKWLKSLWWQAKPGWTNPRQHWRGTGGQQYRKVSSIEEWEKKNKPTNPQNLTHLNKSISFGEVKHLMEEGRDSEVVDNGGSSVCTFSPLHSNTNRELF